MRAPRATPDRDLRMLAHAEGRHGIVTTDQLRAFGFSSSAVDRRLRVRRLHAVHRGVHSIVPASLLSIEGRWLAAVLAAGPGALLSHRAAAALWDLRPIPSGPIDVVVGGDGGRRRRRGLVVHRSRTLTEADRAAKHDIPVTSARRTLADLRCVVSTASWAAAVRQAEILRLDTGPIAGFVPDRAKSDLERTMSRIVRRAGLPTPEVNTLVEGFEVDLLWRTQRLVAEVDSRRFHATPTAFERDRRRDAVLLVAGYRTVRFTDVQIETGPDLVGATLSALLLGA